MDINPLRRWIDRIETATDVVSDRLVDQFLATLGKHGCEKDDLSLLGLHWCLAPLATPQDKIDLDGHAVKGDFLPPVPLPRRMWAAGELQIVQPLRRGDVVKRRSRVADVAMKSGSSGQLIFVSVEHIFSSERGVAIVERQDIAYREQQSVSAEKVSVTHPPTEQQHADRTVQVDVNPMLLFRYSAMTFNSHRIHYDREYARDVEGYQGLVVHGPLQATLLLHLAAQVSGKFPRVFRFRALQPIFDGGSLSLNARSETTSVALWTADAAMTVAMKATME